MLLKRKKPQKNVRNVRRSSAAPVFSYYSNRTDKIDRADHGKSKKQSTKRRPFNFKKLITTVPTAIAVLALVVSLGYISTLSTEPIVQIISSNNPSRNLLADPSEYEMEFGKILDKSPLNRSKLLIDTNEIAYDLSLKYPELGEVSVALPLIGRRPVFKVHPAEPAIILSSDREPVVIDVKGRSLAFTRDIIDMDMISNLPTVVDESSLDVNPGDIVLSAETTGFIKEVIRQLKTAKVSIESITLPRLNVGELRVKVKNKPYFVKFDTKGEGKLQAGAYLATKLYLENRNHTPSQYVDVRVAEKAFYK